MKAWSLLALAVLLPGGSLLALVVWWRRRQQGQHVSMEWLREADRKTERVDFQGVRFKWPINKVVNEHPAWNTKRLRKRA